MDLPAQFVALREIGEDDNPYWVGASDTGADLLLEVGEQVRWQGHCRVASSAPKRWELPFSTTTILTDRRLAFLTTDFDKGGGWVGFGVVGFAVAASANAVSKQRAARRSGGKVLIGHVRHEWLSRMTFRHEKKLIGQNFYIDLACPSQRGEALLRLTSSGSMDGAVAAAYAKAAAGAQLSLAEPVDTSPLSRYLAGDGDPAVTRGPRDRTWGFPGDAAWRIRRALDRATTEGR